MKYMLPMFFVSFLGLALVAVDAEARRMGGGRSMGRSAPATQPRAAPQQQQRAQQPGASQTRPSGASRWLGPLAGLAAGGLLASLFFGDAFEGFQFMDFLLIALLVFGGFMLFRALRARSAAPMQRQGPVPAGATGNANPRPRGGRPSFDVPEIGSGRSGMGSAAAPSQQPRPSWFNEEQFLRAAKAHFVNLQAAWDSADMSKIREYTTPQLFAELDAERQSYSGQQQYTEVVSLDTELLGVQSEDHRVVASVRYSGMIREDRDTPAHPFNEIWHIERALDDPKANWYIAGIEQQGT